MSVLNLDAAIATVKAHRDHLARTHANVQAWDAAGIRSMLIAGDGPPTDILAAALLTAGDASCRLPSAAALRTHWPVNAQTTAPAPRAADLCLPHKADRATCPDCARTREQDKARPETIAAALAAARDAAANTRNRLDAQARGAVERGARP